MRTVEADGDEPDRCTRSTLSDKQRSDKMVDVAFSANPADYLDSMVLIIKAGAYWT